MKKFNNKKGFTLIELIVVMAIIGALAAILIPVMMGNVLRSQVTNANAAASKMRDNVTYFLTQANADGYGMFISDTAVCDVDITVTNGNWSLTTNNPGAFVARGNVKWHGNGDTTNGTSVSQWAEDRLACYLADLFRDVSTAHIEFKLVGGVCYALYFTTDTDADVTEMPGFGNGQPWAVESYVWDGHNQGVTETGLIVGTSPVLNIA